MSHICSELHTIVNHKTNFVFPFNEDDIPKNGIYILFEKGEKGHNGNRIVRIGTHTGVNQLRSRLKQHFLREKKDRSIFRKNIGRCILNRDNDPYLKIWEYDCTSSVGKAKYGHLLQTEYQGEVEAKISTYIQNHFSFGVLELKEKEDRLYYEARLISTVSGCNECRPSENWLGLSSPIEKIRASGLWQVNELYKEPLSPSEMKSLAELIL